MVRTLFLADELSLSASWMNDHFVDKPSAINQPTVNSAIHFSVVGK